jgi:hypothetical protein
MSFEQFWEALRSAALAVRTKFSEKGAEPYD